MKKRTLIYGIYPRSFIGSGGDFWHMGHCRNAFANIAEASSQFLKLGPDYVWMNPIFESGGCDGGYDIVSPFRIDPVYGSEADLESLANGPLRDKVLLDVVFNHASTRSQHFLQDLTGQREDDHCIWADQPNNWESLFGGPAWEYNATKGKYYLHDFAKDQVDLDLANPNVIKHFQDAVKYWVAKGVAGFRIDTCNILCKRSLADSLNNTGLPRGIEFYHQAGSPEILQQILSAAPDCFTVGETVAADADAMRALNGPLTCCFNAAVNDAADGMFMTPAARRETPDYKAWFHALCEAATSYPGFCFQLESHDFPRSVNRFQTDARTLAFLSFMMPFDNVCLYQGQELGMTNREDLIAQGDIAAYASDPHASGLYEKLLQSGKSPEAALSHLDSVSRLHTRIPANCIFGEGYGQQIASELSVFNLYRKLIHLWRTDPVLLHGDLQIDEISEEGKFVFRRTYKQESWIVSLDFSHPGGSYATNGSITIR